ncbi:MAG TPA: thioredoxin family protein [Solirubrobacteraceae bacterium]|nr:thioredoxin family protein [Solirubrobacteraceae bacterium]
MSEVLAATRESFRELVASGLTLVDVWGPDCRPCLALMPHVESIAAREQGLRVVKLEAPKARRLCIELKVHGLPTFLLMQEGQEIARLSAPALAPRQLDAWLARELKTHAASDPQARREVD